MPAFMVLSALTDRGLGTLGENPDRLTGVSAETSRTGPGIFEQRSVPGRHDLLNGIEARDGERISLVPAESVTRGSVPLMPLTAVDARESVKSLA